MIPVIVNNRKLLPVVVLVFFGILTSCQSVKEKTRVNDFNFGWKFALQDTSIKNADLSGLAWRSVQLPHDWSVEASFDSIQGEGATGYLPGGIGWYKKEFKTELTEEEEVHILFDGIYNNATIWINGEKLGFHPYGYSPFHYNLTPYLNLDGADNELQVKVDRTRYVDSRWYTGSGIYRNVQLIKLHRLHIPIWGTFISTPEVSEETATIRIQTEVKNGFDQAQQVTMQHEIYDPNGHLVEKLQEDIEIAKESASTFSKELVVQQPMLWSITQPNLYYIQSTIWQNGEQIDQQRTTFGIRSIEFDAQQGFFLNGKNTAIKGVCLHHDAGLVGAAVPQGVWRRRLEKLKEGGCNAIRISHNPGSEEFLQLCDELGFLVQDEFFDEWDNPKDKRLNMNEQSVDAVTRGYTEHFQEWAERDLKNTMLAHRNHPSIIQWSIGNEIEWTYPRNAAATGFFDADWSGNYFWSIPPHQPETIGERYQNSEAGTYKIEETAAKLASWTRDLDTTRPVVANCILPSASFETGYAEVLDVVGFSYRRVMYDYAQEHYPDKVVMGTENLGQWHEWKAVQERPFIAGTFLWTGIDYMGEANQGWPRKGVASGLLDLAGFEKPAFYMMQSLWSEQPMLAIYSQGADQSRYQRDEASSKVVEKKPGAWEKALWGWHPLNEHWNYEEGEDVIVEILSNCPSIELFLNGESLGQKALSDFEDRIYKWALPFQQGVLLAKGTKDGIEVSTEIKTSSESTQIQLKVDQTAIQANAYDVVHLEIQLLDEAGSPTKTDDRVIELNVEGFGKLLGVDNGAIDNVQDFQANRIRTRQGRALAIIQSERESGVINVHASGQGLKGAATVIKSRQP